MAKDTVTIALNGEVPLSAFADAVQRFRALVEALSAEVGPKVKIQWFVEDLQVSSAVATARGQAEETEVVERVVRAYAAVGHALERHETIPYSKKVAEQALSITTVLDGTVLSIRFETPDEDATIESPSAKRSNATSKSLLRMERLRAGFKHSLVATVSGSPCTIRSTTEQSPATLKTVRKSSCEGLGAVWP